MYSIGTEKSLENLQNRLVTHTCMRKTKLFPTQVQLSLIKSRLITVKIELEFKQMSSAGLFIEDFFLINMLIKHLECSTVISHFYEHIQLNLVSFRIFLFTLIHNINICYLYFFTVYIYRRGKKTKPLK